MIILPADINAACTWHKYAANQGGHTIWLFNDTVRGAQASANLYSLIETAKANGLEPLAYLTMLFRDLPHAHCVEDYERLLPTRWTNDRVRQSLAQSTVPV